MLSVRISVGNARVGVVRNHGSLFGQETQATGQCMNSTVKQQTRSQAPYLRGIIGFLRLSPRMCRFEKNETATNLKTAHSRA